METRDFGGMFMSVRGKAKRNGQVAKTRRIRQKIADDKINNKHLLFILSGGRTLLLKEALGIGARATGRTTNNKVILLVTVAVVRNVYVFYATTVNNDASMRKGLTQ